MKTKETELLAVEVEDEGFVSAGRSVIPFPAPPSSTIVALTPEQAKLAEKGLIKTMTIHGNSLEGVGIYDGDKVVCKKAFSKKEIGKYTVCIVYIPHTGEVVAKKLRFYGKQLLLKSCNPESPDITVDADAVDVRGVVIGLHRAPDELGRFDRGYIDEIPI